MLELSKYIVQGRLTPREIKTLQRDINIYKDRRFESSVGGSGKGTIDLSVRSSKVFFPKAEEFPKTFNILQSTIISAKQVYSYIDLTNFAEIQYARYDEGCFFKKHRDTIYLNSNNQRTLTFSINVSEENEYDGGELVVFDEKGKEVIAELSKEIGSYIVFPAFYFHEAKEVTRGSREAIVTWIHSDDSTHEKFKNEIYNSGEQKL